MPEGIEINVEDVIVASDVIEAVLIRVRAIGADNVEHQFIEPTTTSSDIIAQKALELTSTELLLDEKKGLIECIKITKTFFSKVSAAISINWKEGFTLKFETERSPKEIERTINPINDE